MKQALERWLGDINMRLVPQSCGTSPDSEESVVLQLASVPSTGSLSSRASRLSHSAMSILAATLTTKADVVRLCFHSLVRLRCIFQVQELTNAVLKPLS